MPKRSLPTITKIEYIPTPELELFPRKHLSPADSTSAIGQFTRLNMTEPAQCEITSAQTPNGLTYTSKVTGSIYDEQNEDVQDKLQVMFHNYIMTDVYKQKYLIGIKEKPFPQINFNPINSASPSGKRVVNFEITWISTLPPIKITDL